MKCLLKIHTGLHGSLSTGLKEMAQLRLPSFAPFLRAVFPDSGYQASVGQTVPVYRRSLGLRVSWRESRWTNDPR